MAEAEANKLPVGCRPTLSASLEYLKYCGGKHLPSQLMEAELDSFGAHSYDLKSDGDGEVKKGG